MKDSGLVALGGLFLAIILVLALTIGPFVFIWSVNVLFGLSIPYTWRTVLAAFALITIFGPVGNKK